MTEKQDNQKEYHSVILAALLHDIGKFIQRADDHPTKMTHQEFGATWLREKEIPGEVASIVERHHLLEKTDPKYKDLDARISNSTLIVCQADWLSAAERPKKKEMSSKEEAGWKFDIPLLSIFSRIHLSSEKDILRYLEPSPLSSKISYPKTDLTLNREIYKERLKDFQTDFMQIRNSLTVNNVLVLLEKHTSFVPSETQIVEEKPEWYPDVSLFDHLKTTAAITRVIHLYLMENYPGKYQENELLANEIQDMKDAKFLLIGGDFSGVQKFIYTISSKGALKTLRARSFFLELLTEHLIAELLKNLGLIRANTIYSGGGRFYMLAPNTNSVKKNLDILKSKINRWLFEEFRGKLYLAMGRIPFCGDDFQSDRISEIWSDLGSELARSKSRKFERQLKEILDPSEPKIPFDTCSVCHRDDIDETELEPLSNDDPENKACSFCRSLFHLGDELIDARYIGKTENETLAKRHSSHPIKLRSTDDNNLYYVPLKTKETDFDSLYVINSWSLNDYKISNAVPLLVGNYVRKVGELPELARKSKFLNSTASFSELAKTSRGADRIGVLRMDVDNLGEIFTRGFKKELRSFPRLTSLSRQLTLFFKFYINAICQGYFGSNVKPLDLSEKLLTKNEGRNLSVIYSGGDDLFLVGAWDEITEIAFDIHNSFKLYTCQNPDVNISGGMIVQREDFCKCQVLFPVLR